MTSKPRLVHLTTTPTRLEELLSPQLAAFREEGFEVTSVSAPGPHLEAIEAAGIHHVPVPAFTGRLDPRADLRAGRELSSLLQRLDPHILHTHNPKPGVLGRLLGRRRRVPIVVNTVHGLHSQLDTGRGRRAGVYAAEALALRFSDMELVQNIEDMFTLRQLGAPRSKVLHLGTGIDLERFRAGTASRARGLRLRRQLGIPPSAFVVGMVARFVWEKGYAEYFGAIEDLRRAGYDDIHFVVVGTHETGGSDAVDRATLQRMTATGVHVLGPRRDIENVYAALDVFVLPAYGEGVPRAAMEAQAMGVPVVAADGRGSRQVVDDGMTGLLVPARRARPVARAIAQLHDAPPTRRAMAAAAVRRASVHFDQDRVIDRTLGVYRNQLRAAGFVTEPAPVISLRDTDSISLVDIEASESAALTSAV